MSAATEQIRVVIVDDHVMVGQGLATVLGAQPDIDVVAVAQSASEAHAVVRRHDPHVVVMDYRLPDADGAQTAARIRAEHPGTAVVMVTASDHDTVLAAALDAGCAGFVTKERAIHEVATAVRRAHAGEATVPPAMLARLLPRLSSGRRTVGALTPREREILQLLAEGKSNRDIAEQLNVSVSTVRNHVQNVLTKLDVHSKLEAVVAAQRQGFIDYPGA